MDIPKQKKGYLVDVADYGTVIKAVRNWQKQVSWVNEESLDGELENAFIDWGVVQGYINALTGLRIISSEDYKFLSNKQLMLWERLNKLKEKR